MQVKRPTRHAHSESNHGVVGMMHRIVPQPLIGVGLALLATAAIATGWRVALPSMSLRQHATLLVALCLAVVLSRFWPIRIGSATRLYLSSIPLYLLTCAFDPVVAASAVAGSLLVREIATCRECANRSGTILAQVGRWTLLSYGVSSLVHLWSTDYLMIMGVFAGLVLWLGDIITCPLVFAPITRQRPRSIITSAFKQSFIGEMMQYTIAWLCLMLGMSALNSSDGWIAAANVVVTIIFTVVLLYLYLKGEEGLADAQRHLPDLVPQPATSRR